MTETIYCTGCEELVETRLTSGKEIYPHRPDLYEIPIWKCDACENYVGCHWRDKKDPLRPLGVIATRELMSARKHIHALLDPLWKSRRIKRRQAYAYISNRLGRNYHTGELRSLEEAREVYRTILKLKGELE